VSAATVLGYGIYVSQAPGWVRPGRDNERFGLARALGRRRWAGVSAEERSKVAGAGGRSAWASMTAKERSAEMKRRAAKRKKKP